MNRMFVSLSPKRRMYLMLCIFLLLIIQDDARRLCPQPDMVVDNVVML